MTAAPLDAFSSATAMLQALRERRISAVELLDLHLSRIARYNPAVNAIATPNFERAREAAEAADAAWVRNEDRPLLGLPLTIKDSINVRGLRTTHGLERWAGHVAERDALVVSRIRAAGGVILGKTNVPPGLADFTSDNPIFGRTNNPWDLGRTPGGSTGGGAAALAAGLTPLEYGSDIAGSIRVPAAFCGVYGHKSSETALPRSGQFPGSSFPNPSTRMAVIGPLARAAEDLELALDVAAGPDVGEEAAWRLEIPPARHERLAEFRVAILPRIAWLPVANEIMASFDEQARRLSKAGVRVQEALPEGFGDLREHHHTYSSLLTAIASSGLPPDERRAIADRLRDIDDEIVQARLRGMEATAADYITLHWRRERYRAAYRAFFREWDVLLTPATIVPAFPHPDPTVPRWVRTLEVDGQNVSYGLQNVLPGLATLSGQPATVFPAGLTVAGLPIGLQAIGPYLEDRTPIRFAALVAREWGGFRPPPRACDID